MNPLSEKIVTVGRFLAKMAVYMFVGFISGLFIADVVGLAQGKTYTRMIRVPENSVNKVYFDDLKTSPYRLFRKGN